MWRRDGYTRWMFERFTERARQAVVFAQDEAGMLKHTYIGTEHLLLGLLRDDETLAAMVLREFDVTLEKARAEVAGSVGWGVETPVGQAPFTARAKTALESALEEALSLGISYIGTEHILLGLVRDQEGVGAQILAETFGASGENVRVETMRLVRGGFTQPSTQSAGGGVGRVDQGLLVGRRSDHVSALWRGDRGRPARDPRLRIQDIGTRRPRLPSLCPALEAVLRGHVGGSHRPSQRRLASIRLASAEAPQRAQAQSDRRVRILGFGRGHRGSTSRGT